MDLVTLSLSIGLFNALIALMMGLYAIFRRDRSIWIHAAGFCSGVVGFFLLGSQGRIPPLFGVVISNTLIAGFPFLVTVGFREALSVAPSWPRRYTVYFSLWLAFVLSVTFIWNLAWLRAIVFAVFVLIPQVEALVTVLKRRGEPQHTVFWIAVSTIGVFIVLYTVRLYELTRVTAEGYFVLGQTPAGAFTFILTLAFTAAWAGLAVMMDVSGLVRCLEDRNRELERHANHDSLTGLFNRKRMEEDLRREMERQSRAEGSSSLIMLDLDRFKLINDGMGHVAGDMALQRVSREILRTIRHTDSAYRWGGDEFFVIAVDTDAAGAAIEAERLRVAVEKIPPADFGTVTVSLGVAGYRADDTIDSWISRADDALYRAKESGRNRVIES